MNPSVHLGVPRLPDLTEASQMDFATLPPFPEPISTRFAAEPSPADLIGTSGRGFVTWCDVRLQRFLTAARLAFGPHFSQTLRVSAHIVAIFMIALPLTLLAPGLNSSREKRDRIRAGGNLRLLGMLPTLHDGAMGDVGSPYAAMRGERRYTECMRNGGWHADFAW
jgi:hypothetical protein